MSRIHSFVKSGCGSAWLERCVRDAEVAGSNPVTPTFLQIKPFGEYVKRLSLFCDKTYVAQSTVQFQMPNGDGTNFPGKLHNLDYSLNIRAFVKVLSSRRVLKIV